MRKPKGVFLSETIDAYFHERITVPAVAKATVLGEARGEARGETRGKTETLLHILEKKIQKVPRETEKRIRETTDPAVLDSWAVHAAVCSSMKEFIEVMK